jgi:hypothetical protein
MLNALCRRPAPSRFIKDLYFSDLILSFHQARMARGIRGLSKVSPGPAQPDPSMPCGQATPETASQLFRVWPIRRAGGLRPSSIPLDTPRRTGLLFVFPLPVVLPPSDVT